MAAVDLTEETFMEKKDDGIVFLDFWASWCGPCRTFAPIYESVSKKHPDILFGKVNTEVERALAGSFGIQAIPTLVAMRDGVVLFQQPGVVPESALEDLIDQVKKVDMEEVRRQLAARG